MLVHLILVVVPVLFVLVVFVLFVLVVVLHALDGFLCLDVLAQGIHKVYNHHIGVHGFGQRVFHPRVALAADIHEGIAGGNLHDVLGGRLVAVQVHAVIQKHDDFDIFRVTYDFAYPVVDREDGGHDADLLSLCKGSARKHKRKQHDKGSDARNILFHDFLRLFDCNC